MSVVWFSLWTAIDNVVCHLVVDEFSTLLLHIVFIFRSSVTASLMSALASTPLDVVKVGNSSTNFYF